MVSRLVLHVAGIEVRMSRTLPNGVPASVFEGGSFLLVNRGIVPAVSSVENEQPKSGGKAAQANRR